MRIFRDRREAGRLLAERLGGRAGKDWIVLAIPRGGVVVGRIVADELGIPMDIIIARKLGASGDSELAIGAIADDGTFFLDERMAADLHISKAYIEQEAERQKREISRRLDAYRGDAPRPPLKGRGVIIVDDGVATGSTMKAAVLSARKRGAGPIIVAVPVAPPSTVSELGKVADEVVCLQAPPYFQAVGQFFGDFPQTSDEQVVALMKPARASR